MNSTDKNCKDIKDTDKTVNDNNKEEVPEEVMALIKKLMHKEVTTK